MWGLGSERIWLPEIRRMDPKGGQGHLTKLYIYICIYIYVYIYMYVYIYTRVFRCFLDNTCPSLCMLCFGNQATVFRSALPEMKNHNALGERCLKSCFCYWPSSLSSSLLRTLPGIFGVSGFHTGDREGGSGRWRQCPRGVRGFRASSRNAR